MGAYNCNKIIVDDRRRLRLPDKLTMSSAERNVRVQASRDKLYCIGTIQLLNCNSCIAVVL